MLIKWNSYTLISFDWLIFIHAFDKYISVVTLSSYLQPMAAFAPHSATLLAWIIPHNIKLQPLPMSKGEIDYEVI